MNPTGIDAREAVTGSSSVRFRVADLKWYGLAALSVGAALGLALLLRHFHFREAAVPLLLLACAISSWYGGRGPAVPAVVLSSMGFDYFFTERFYAFEVSTSDIPYFIIFASSGVLLSWFAAVRRRIEEAGHRTALELRDFIETIPVMAWSARRRSSPSTSFHSGVY